MQKNCKFLLSFTLWPLIWPLRPSSAFFNFFEILITYEVQWYAKMFYLSSITSRTISKWDLAFWPTVTCHCLKSFIWKFFFTTEYLSAANGIDFNILPKRIPMKYSSSFQISFPTILPQLLQLYFFYYRTKPNSTTGHFLSKTAEIHSHLDTAFSKKNCQWN